jgi:hypothetical protein
MHFAMLIPDWNSLDSVRRAHSDLEFAALLFFALLVFFDILAHWSEDKTRERFFEKIGLCFFAAAVLAEIVAYPYSQRNDMLSAQEINSLDQKAQDARASAESAAGAAARANDSAEELAQYTKWLAESVNPRHIDTERFAELMKGQPIAFAEIWYEADEEEAQSFAEELGRELGHKPRGIGWNVRVSPFPARLDKTTGDPQIFNILRRTAGIEGMAIAARDVSLSNSQLSSLREAIQLSTGGLSSVSGLEEFFGDATLPKRYFVIGIGRHQPNVPLVKFAHSKK